MANIYKVVLPTGKEMNLQSDEPPSEEQLNTLLSQELPKYKMESNVDSPKYNYALDRKFRSAKIGESLKDPASGLVFIKASPTEYVAPDYEAEAIKSSPGGAALRAAGFSAPATLAGVTAGGRAAAITPGGTPAKILTGLVAGGGAAIATQLLQDKAIEKVAPEVNRRLERDLAEQPNAVVVGNVASALPALRPGKIASTLKQEVGQRAISAGLGGSVQLGSELARSPDGLQEGAGTRALLAAAGEAILDKPTSLGRRLMGTPVPKKPTLVTQIDSGVVPSTIAGSKDLIRMLGTPDASGRSDPRSVMERLVNPAGAGSVKSAAESARTLDLLPKRAAESAEVFSAIPAQQSDISQGLVKARNILQKEMDEFIGPIKTSSAKESAETFGLALEKSENLNLEALKRNQAEAINNSFEKVIGVRDPSTFTAQETELAKRLAAADVNYAGVEGQAPVLRDFLGQDVVYNGYTGRLTQSDDGKIVVTFPFRRKGGAQEIAIEGASSFDDVAKSLGVYPKNPIEIPEAVSGGVVKARPEDVAAESAQAIAPKTEQAPESTISKVEATAEAGPTRVAVDDDDAIEAAAAAQAKRKFKGVSQAGSKGSVLIPGEASPRFKTPEFKKWFGKGIFKDKDGNPVALFHGTKSKEKFSSFDTERRGYHFGKGSYFTPSPRRADDYAGFRDYYEEGSDAPEGSRVLKVFTSIENPYYVSSDQSVSDLGRNLERTDNAKFKKLEVPGGTYADVGNALVREMGYDSIIKQWKDGDPLEVVVFDNKKIKSATGNSGQFNSGMSDISAGINPTLLVDAGSTFIGATLGYQVGDTQEERLRNAAIGAAIGAGGRVGAKALEKALKSSRGVVSNLMAKAPQIVQKLRSEASEGLREYFLENPDVTPVGKEGPSGLATTTHEDIPEYTYSETLANTPFFSQARELFLNMDAAIRSASPRTFGALNKYEQALKKLNHDFRLVSKKFSSTMRSSFKNEDDWKEFQKAAMNGNVEGVNSAAAKTENPQAVMDSYNETRALLDQIYKMEVAAGRDLNYIPNHFPRKIADYKKLLKAMGRQERGVFESAWAAEKRKVGRDLTEFEKAKIVNQTINGVFRTGNKPSFMKGRTIKEVDDFLIDYYEPIDVSLESYVGRAAQDITDRNWFGSLDEADPKIGGSFGDTIAEEISSGRMTPENEETVLRNLQARRKLNRTAATATEKLANSTRMMTSLAFLGDFQAGVAQAADALMAVQNSGLRSGAKGVLERLSDVPKSAGDKKKSLTLEDLYLALDSDEINQFAQANKGRLARTTEFVLKRTVGSLDRFGKESLLQASWNQFRRAASNPDSSEFKKLKQKYEKIYPEDFNQMVDDLANNRLTDNTRLLLMTEVGGLQPILPSSMPPFYANSPRGRMIYTLKSFWVKQLNRMRTEGLEKINNGIKTGNVGAITEGTAWMGQYLAFMATSGFAIDAFRDYLMGREVKPEEIRLSAVLKIFGVSKYMASDVAKEGPFNAALAWAFPIAEVFRDATLDAQKVAEYTGDLISGDRTDFIEDVAKESEMLQYVPFLGRSAYNLWGKGKSNIEKREYEESRGRPQPGVKESFIRMLNPDYRDDGSE